MSDIASALISLGLGALGALMGAILLWKFWALPKIRGWIFDQGSQKLKEYIDHVAEDPEGEEAKRVGKLAGVAFAYIVQGLFDQLQTKEGREQWKPIFEVVQDHIMKSIAGSWGNIIKNLQSEGQAGGLPGEFSIPAPIAGIAQRIFPGVDPSQLISMARWLSSISGGQGLSLGGSTSRQQPGNNGGEK